MKIKYKSSFVIISLLLKDNYTHITKLDWSKLGKKIIL